MLNAFVDNLRNLDIKVKNIMKYGFLFSLIFCLFSILILYTYHKTNHSPLAFTIGIILFKTSIMFFVDFFICGIAFNNIKKNMNLKT